MEALKANIEIIPNNQIWYTSKNGKIVEPYNTSGFQFKIVSNVYENGKGVITFEKDLTSFPKHLFRDCTSLANINIPNSVTTIGQRAFSFCTSLSNVTIPNSVTYIGYNAFNNTPLLKEVHVQSATSPSLGGNNFSGALDSGTIYVPCSCQWINKEECWRCSSV